MDIIGIEGFRAAEGVEDWQARATGAHARFSTGDFATGSRLLAAIAELAEAVDHHPDVTVRYPVVDVRIVTHSARGLTEKDAQLARAISAAARGMGIEADTRSMEEVMIAITTPDPEAIAPFWAAVTGYARVGERELADLRGDGPLVWLQPIDRPLRGRSHLDVNLPREEAEARLAAAVAAGGTLVDDSNAPAWWTLADADGHKVDVCSWGS